MNDLIAHLKETKKTFADKLGISQSVITHLTTGRNNPGFEIIQKILITYPRVSPDWLLLNQGEIFRETKTVDWEELGKNVTLAEKKVYTANYELHQALKILTGLSESFKGE
jgi:transcriptional regulator with XRE-family HTH domain